MKPLNEYQPGEILPNEIGNTLSLMTEADCVIDAIYVQRTHKGYVVQLELQSSWDADNVSRVIQEDGYLNNRFLLWKPGMSLTPNNQKNADLLKQNEELVKHNNSMKEAIEQYLSSQKEFQKQFFDLEKVLHRVYSFLRNIDSYDKDTMNSIQILMGYIDSEIGQEEE